MARDAWRKSILHNCLENDTCVIFDRAAAWCEYYPDKIMFCSFENCPQMIISEMEIGRAFVAMNETQAERQKNNLLQAGFRVKTTNKGNKYFVWRAE